MGGSSDSSGTGGPRTCHVQIGRVADGAFIAALRAPVEQDACRLSRPV